MATAVKKAAKKAAKKPAKKAAKKVAKAPAAVKRAGGSRLPAQKKGTYRVRLRNPAVRALGLNDADKVAASGLTVVKEVVRTTTFDGSKTAFNNLRKDLAAMTGDKRPEGVKAGDVWAAKRALVRVDAALEAGPYAGQPEQAAEEPAAEEQAPE